MLKPIKSASRNIIEKCDDMNIRQIQYAVMLYNTRSFSLVADELNISQPALSKQILNLEKEIGTKLFERNTIPLSVTPAGEYFVAQAQSLLESQDKLISSMKKFVTEKKEELTIGISPFRSLYLMPKITNQILKEFKNTEVVLREAGGEQLRKEILEGKYDFAVINLPVDENALEVIPLEADKLVLAVPNDLALNLSESNEAFPEIDFSLCKNIPFVMVSPGQEMRKLCDKLCNNNGFVPDIAAQVVGVTTAWTLAASGVGATLVPYQFIKNQKTDTVRLFKIKDKLYTRQPAIVYKKGHYLSDSAKYAIKLLTENF